MPQGERGIVELFTDFTTEDNIAETAETRNYGDFIIGGQGNAEVDSGVVTGASDPNLGGVGRLTTTDEVDHTLLVGTNIMWDVGLMGTIMAECRIQLNNLDTKEVFFGFSDIDPNTMSIQGSVVHGTGTTITNTASDFVGFLLSAELTDDEDWHAVYNGGSASAVTTSASLDLDDDAVAGEWQVLKLVLKITGEVEWYIDEVLVKTLAGAVSTSTDLALALAVEAKTAAIENLDADYLLVRGSRDWTV
jgi:hypothetical protein